MTFLQNYTEFWNFPSKWSACTSGTCCTYAVSSQKGAADKCWICTNVSKSKQPKCYSISLVLWCLEINIGSAYLGRFGAFLSMSAAYSLPNWWSLQFCLVTEKNGLGNTVLDRGKVLHGTAAAVVYWSQGTRWSLETARSRAGDCPYWCWTRHSIARISASRRALFRFHTCPQPPPCAFSPAPSPHIWLSPTSLTGRCFSHHPPTPKCKNYLILLFDGTFSSQAENNF